jgi:hypothetical protein
MDAEPFHMLFLTVLFLQKKTLSLQRAFHGAGGGIPCMQLAWEVCGAGFDRIRRR